MRSLKTTPKEQPWLSDEMSPDEKKTVMQEFTALSKGEISELDTGRRIVLVRSILEKYSKFWYFIGQLPFTERTAYRRIKTYERAVKLWPEEVVEAAIERRLKVIGWTNEKPMGLFEDVEHPPKTLPPPKVNEYLNRAELLVRRASQEAKPVIDAYAALKRCFRLVERATQSLPPNERVRFLDDLVGLEMTLLGVDESKKFAPAQVPQDFWTSQGGYTRSSETRERIRKAATERWERVKAAKAAKLKRRA